MKLALQTLASAVFGLVFFGVLLFVPAGTVNYWQAWVFIAVFIAATIGAEHLPGGATTPKRCAAGCTPVRPRKPGPCNGSDLLRDIRVGGGTAGGQRARSPLRLVDGAAVARRGGRRAGGRRARCSPSGSSFRTVTPPQRSRSRRGSGSVTTGLYGLVRHPMYAGALIMMLGTPLALDSYWGLVVVIPGGGRAGRPDPRRGEDADRRTGRLPRVPATGALPVDTECVVTARSDPAARLTRPILVAWNSC